MTHRSAARSPRHPGGAAGVLAALALLAGELAAQEWRRDEGQARGRLFSLPRSQDDIYEWRRAGDEVREGRVSEAVERLHRLLQNGQPGVVPIDDSGDRFMGLHAAVLATLRDLPAEGRAAYEKLTEREAGRLLRTAFDGGRPEQLLHLAASFPTSAPGLRARLHLGDLALEAGRGIEAEFHYRAALDGAAQDAPERAAIQQRMWAAQVVAGTSPHSSPAERRSVEDDLRAVLPGEPGAIAGGWPAYGGGGDGSGIMTRPLGDLRLQHQIDIRARGFRDRMYPMHAVGDLTGILLNDGVTIHCIDPLAGVELWRAPGPLGDEPQALDEYARSINRDMVLAAACSAEVVVAALQVPSTGQNTRFRHIDVIRHIPRRRLFAVDRATGKRLWGHWDHADGAVSRRFEGHDAAGPPLIHGDTVFVASHDQTGAVAFYLSAYDLATGEPRWRHLVCSSQGEVNMFGNSRREYAASPLAIADGLVFGTTNLGVCFAAEAGTGRIRWVTAYEVIPLPETRLTDQRDRQVIFANNTAVVTDGVVSCTPLDSAYALGFDTATGELLWRLYHRAPAQRANDVRWLLGAQGDEFVFSGLGVVAVKARPQSTRNQPSYRRVRSPESLGLASDMLLSPHTIPRGALTEDRIYYASPAGLRVFNRRGDARIAKLVTRNGGLGNLLLVDGILVSLREGSLELYYDRDKLVREAEEHVRKHRGDPAALLRLASLVRGGSATPVTGAGAERAEQLYRRGLDAARRSGMGPRSPIYRRLARELFRLSVERANALRLTRPDVALELMRGAREGALGAEDWLRAQGTILDWVRGDPATYLAELDLMARRHGSAMHVFPGTASVPVAAYALWQTALHTGDAADAVRRCQDLMDTYPDVVLGSELARDLARDRQLQLIRQHGAEVYAAIEARAQAALRSAAGDPELLAAVARRYPHSRAARTALTAIMDLAVERGDLAAAARSYSQAVAEGEAGPGVLRRMLQAARVADNRPLARELARRLLDRFGTALSDYGPDDRRPMSEVVTVPPAAPAPGAVALQRPFDVVARKVPDAASIGLRLCHSQLVDGFAPPDRLPLLVSVDGARLEAFDPDRGGEMFDRPLFSVPFTYQEGEDLLVCGNTLVLPELDQLRGVDLRTGEQRWSVRGGTDRMLVSLGCQAGILHVFSELRDAGDGGILLGVEPLSGAVMFRRPFPRDQQSTPPASSAGALWAFRPGLDDQPEILRLDALDGRPTHRIPLGADLLRRLGLGDRDLRSFRAHLLHKTMFADAETVYVPVDGDERSSPRLAAIDFGGRERWPLWRGMRGRELAMAALWRDRVVLVERGSRGGRLLLLDARTGALQRELPVGPHVSIRNWSRTEWSAPVPGQLMLVDHANLNLNLLCYSLDQQVPSFTYGLQGRHEHVVAQPVLGEDFVAIAARRRDNSFSLFVLDLKSRLSVLPDGKNKLLLRLLPPFKMHTTGSYVVVQSAEGISVLGEPGRPPK